VCPAIGAYLTEWFVWRAIFVVLGGLGAVVLAVAAARLPETLPAAVPLDLVGLVRSHLTLFRSREFALYALASAASSASWFTFVASAPYFLAARLHRPPSTYAVMILLPMAAYMLGNAAAARGSRRVGSATIFIAGLAISLASGVLMAAWCASAPGIWALFVPWRRVRSATG
jgi:DHA1 family bicyclomycin/chloramphenicol resistance-like MFS transporter